MSLLYSIGQVVNPQKPETSGKFYARSQTRNTVTTKDLIADIAWGTTLTKGDVYHVLVTLGEIMKKRMLNGDCVELMDIGKFRYQISSAGAETKEDFNKGYIRKVKIQFSPDVALIPDPKDISVERTLPVRVQKRLKKRR